ncbi:MAG: helix-turn-helix domain-containing protein [Polyangiaceae bacterium]
MRTQRPPRPALRPFVSLLWALDETDAEAAARPARERVLPTGHMHLVVRFGETPLTLLGEDGGGARHVVGHAIVGGARASAYLRDVSRPVRSVGARLHPGAAELLFGVPAGELCERHTRLEDLWGQVAVSALREQLAAAPDPTARLALFEAALERRLPRVRGVHPAVAQALRGFGEGSDVARAVSDSGYSHRHFVELFRAAVGLAPKVYCRVLRLSRAISLLGADARARWVDVAIDAGYSDQSHFIRDFREMTALSPGDYRTRAPQAGMHVPVADSAPRAWRAR